MSQWNHVLALSMFAALLPSTAHADGECGRGYRDFTAAERAAMTSVLERVKSALPPPPSGWILISSDEVAPPRSLCRDIEQVPWAYSFSRYYGHVADQDVRDRALDKAADTAAELEKKKQPRLDAIMAQMTKINEQKLALVSKGDYAGAAKFDPEIDRLTTEYQKIADEGTDQIAQEAAPAGRDVELMIEIQINYRSQTPNEGAQPMTLPAGARSARRWTITKDGISESTALILFGNWTAGPRGRMESVPKPGAPMSAVHDLTVLVKADESRLASMVNAIDFASLARLLGR